jgi:hypothetical protein
MPPLFNSYEGGEHYGLHVDGSVRNLPNGAGSLRTDVSSTLFLWIRRNTRAANWWWSIPMARTRSSCRRAT